MFLEFGSMEEQDLYHTPQQHIENMYLSLSLSHSLSIYHNHMGDEREKKRERERELFTP
jgi:hypothetical protein